jgi:hypothetical protein|tara:strand:+ start:7862 stop:8116 length:255 start_codon:yes stop_codon:yes gene_type:complete
MADEQQNQNQEDQAKEQQEKLNDLIKTYKLTFESEHGATVLEDLQRRCHLFSTTNVKGDSHESAFMEGQRAAILFIIQMLNRKI